MFSISILRVIKSKVFVKRHRLPRASWSRSIASNSALKLPTPKPYRMRRSLGL